MFLDAGVNEWSSRATRSLAIAFALASTAGAQVPGELRGRVTDAATGRGVRDAGIEIADRSGVVRTDQDGAFVVRGLAPQRYVVTVRAFGYEPARRKTEVENGRSAVLEVSIARLPVALRPIASTAPVATGSAATATFDRAGIERSGRRDVGELLSGVPGVVVTRSGGPGQPEQASIRGSSAADVLVVVDGVVANSPLTGVADLSQLALGSVQRVTVLEGAQSARYGGRALAGVVVVDTRQPDRDATLDLGAGSWGERDLAASLGDAIGSSPRASGLVSFERRTTRGDFPYDVPVVRGGGTARRDNADASTANVLAVGSLDAGTTSVRLRGDLRSADRGVPGSIVQPSLTGREDEHHAGAAADVRTAPGLMVLDASASVAHDQSHYSDPAPPFGSSYDDLLTATELRATSSASATAAFLDLAAGADGRWMRIDASSLATSAPRSQRIVGAYGQLRAHRELGTVALAATLRGRVDDDDLLAGTVTSPGASIELGRGKTSLSASIANGFSPPSLADQFFHEGVLVRANRSLAPEQTRGELEARAAVRDLAAGPLSLGADATVVRADVHGMILWSPDFRFIWSPANVDVRRSGWELTSRATVPALGVELRGSVDRTDVAYTGAAQTGQVIYRPRTTGQAGGSIERRFARVDAEARYVGMRRTVAGSDLNALAPYWLADARLSLPLIRSVWRVDAALGVDNVFNRPAAMLVDFPFGGRRWTLTLRTKRGGRDFGE